MPSRYSSEHSVDDAVRLARTLGHRLRRRFRSTTCIARTRALPIVGDDLLSQPAGLADQNLQARIRGAIVMIRSNRHGWLALATGNKSELAVGYCTLYGDMAGGFAVLGDVLKRDVYAVSRYINEVREQRESDSAERARQGAERGTGAESVRPGHAAAVSDPRRDSRRTDRATKHRSRR